MGYIYGTRSTTLSTSLCTVSSFFIPKLLCIEIYSAHHSSSILLVLSSAYLIQSIAQYWWINQWMPWLSQAGGEVVRGEIHMTQMG
jgi:hypothetical protein